MTDCSSPLTLPPSTWPIPWCRASGEHRVERAIVQALDTPLLYGNDIGRAQRILFDIYTSDEEPLYIDEMEEIEDFMRQLDPNISVIWGTSTDNSLGADVKVIILATGMEKQVRPSVTNVPLQKDEDYYLSLMQQLYAPKTQTVQKTLFSEEELDATEESAPAEPQAEPDVEPKKEADEEPAQNTEPEPVEIEVPVKERTFLEKAKEWLMNLTKEEV